MVAETQLAEALAARLCHDLGGAVGTLAGTLDLVGEGDTDLLGLARETAIGLRQRLCLFAAAWGGVASELGAEEIAALLAGAPSAGRVTFHLAALAPGGTLPAPLVPLALNAALLGAEALPRGGTVLLGGTAEDGLVVSPAGRDAAWPAGLRALFAGATSWRRCCWGRRPSAAGRSPSVPAWRWGCRRCGWSRRAVERDRPIGGTRSPIRFTESSSAPPSLSPRPAPSRRACGG
jgi:histidine phosphotransferase ChpT